MKAFYTDHFVLPLPAGHRFPMEKYSCLRDLVKTVAEIDLIEAPAASDTQILYAHDPHYLINVIEGKLNPQEQREIGFPWSEKMVEPRAALRVQLSQRQKLLLKKVLLSI